MTLRTRLKALERELEQAQEGSGVEVWWMVDGRPGYYSRVKDQGEAVALADLPHCPPGSG